MPWKQTLTVGHSAWEASSGTSSLSKVSSEAASVLFVAIITVIFTFVHALLVCDHLKAIVIAVLFFGNGAALLESTASTAMIRGLSISHLDLTLAFFLLLWFGGSRGHFHARVVIILTTINFKFFILSCFEFCFTGKDRLGACFLGLLCTISLLSHRSKLTNVCRIRLTRIRSFMPTTFPSWVLSLSKFWELFLSQTNTLVLWRRKHWWSFWTSVKGGRSRLLLSLWFWLIIWLFGILLELCPAESSVFLLLFVSIFDLLHRNNVGTWFELNFSVFFVWIRGGIVFDFLLRLDGFFLGFFLGFFSFFLLFWLLLLILFPFLLGE